MGLDYQLHRVSVDIAKGYRQIQKAGAAISKGKEDSAARHLNDALNDFGAAMTMPPRRRMTLTKMRERSLTREIRS